MYYNIIFKLKICIDSTRARVGLIFSPGVSCLRPVRFCLCTGLFSAFFALSIIHFYLFFARFSLFLFEQGAAFRGVVANYLRCHCQLTSEMENKGQLWFFIFYYLKNSAYSLRKSGTEQEMLQIFVLYHKTYVPPLTHIFNLSLSTN